MADGGKNERKRKIKEWGRNSFAGGVGGRSSINNIHVAKQALECFILIPVNCVIKLNFIMDHM